MRIVIDLQGAQTESRYRGIGRYSLSLAKAIAKNRGEHEVLIVLSALFPDTIEPIRTSFDALLPQENIRVWRAISPVRECQAGNEHRREAAESIREVFLASLQPDVLFIPSLFEGFLDDAVTSINFCKPGYLTLVTLHDLIPLIDAETYLTPNPLYESHYKRKLEHFSRAAGYLAVSEYSAREGVKRISLQEDTVAVVHNACDAIFRPITTADFDLQQRLSRLNISKPFILNTGGADERKNLPRLIQAFASLPASLKGRFQLLLAGKYPDVATHALSQLALDEGLGCDDCVFAGYIPDEELAVLYSHCSLFVFPSWHEGFGLPPLEAMNCGAPVIGANTSSLPEVIGWEDALFDPFDVRAIAGKVEQALTDGSFRQQLIENGRRQAKRFSWDASAIKAIEFFETRFSRFQKSRTCVLPGGRKPKLAYVSPLQPEKSIYRRCNVELIQELEKFYDVIFVVLGSYRAVDPLVSLYCTVRNREWLEDNLKNIDRIIYYLGVPPFRTSEIALFEKMPGILSVHDLLFDTTDSCDVKHSDIFSGWEGEMYRSSPYADAGISFSRVIGMLVPSQSFKNLVQRWYGESAEKFVAVVPFSQMEFREKDSAAFKETSFAKHLALFCVDFIENLYTSLATRPSCFIRHLKAIKGQFFSEHEFTDIARALSRNFTTEPGIKQLFLDVSELSQRDSATGVQRVVRSYLHALLQFPPPGFRVEPVYAALDEGYRYARRFTQNFMDLPSSEDNFSDELVKWQRGDIFFGLDMQGHIQLAHRAFYLRLRMEGVTVKFLVHDLLPIQLPDCFRDPYAGELHGEWLKMLSATDGVVCVSKATAEAYLNWIEENKIPTTPNFQISWVHNGGDIGASKPSYGLPPNAQRQLDAISSRPAFLSVGTFEPRKRQEQIFDAFQLLWDEGLELNLVLTGQEGWSVESLAEKIRNHPKKDKNLFRLQDISDEYLEKVYASSICLIAASVNEGFGLPLVESARHKLPIIARDIPVFREIAEQNAFYFSGMNPEDLAKTIREWFDLYCKGSHPRSEQLRWFTWKESAEKLKAEITLNCPNRQIFVDISELVQRDVGSGIQRVVRSILKEWLHCPPIGYRVEPVYATLTEGYRYARRFTQRFFDCFNEITDELEDTPIEYMQGDIFFVLDLKPEVAIAHRQFYRDMRIRGIMVFFLVHDLLSLKMPQFFPKGTKEGFTQLFGVIIENDGAVCVSKATADDLAQWVKTNFPSRADTFKIEWSHNGADIEASSPSKGVPPEAHGVLEGLYASPCFLMVGTIEPRKGHSQTLIAFEELWQQGESVNLCIVGKEGWMVEDLLQKLRSHPENGRRLFLLRGISDEFLEMVYAASTCLIFASEGEGFGLPLIEAAKHRLPIIARDIPVFREVAGEHAFYFSGKTGSSLAEAIREWMGLYHEGRHPKSYAMPWLTWKQSAERMKEIILRGAENNMKQMNISEQILEK